MVAVELITEAVINRCRVKIACEDLAITFNTYLHWKADIFDNRKGPRNGPVNKLDQQTRDQIIEVAALTEFVDLSPWVIVAKLADQGRYVASESSFYKILKEKNMLSHRGKSEPRKHNRPVPLVATGANQIWSWDITYVKSTVTGMYFYLYLFLDVYSRKIVGFDMFFNESMEHSAMLFEKLCINENIQKDQLVLHSDNGGAMKGATMLATMQRLGVIPSFSRPRVSDDNPYSEALFKTVKYHHTFPGSFQTIEDAKRWMIGFVSWYNDEHYHSGIKFVTPSQRHLGLDINILNKRKEVYLAAKEKHPERWNGRSVKNFDHDKNVFLNYLQKEKLDAIGKAA
jgi:transposase InsO family protein